MSDRVDDKYCVGLNLVEHTKQKLIGKFSRKPQ